jgi:hypothetical protein
MSEKEWAVAYTDEQYLLRSEVVKAMNTTLIDGYWADILAYRKSKMIALPFKTITNHLFLFDRQRSDQSQNHPVRTRQRPLSPA